MFYVIQMEKKKSIVCLSISSSTIGIILTIIFQSLLKKNNFKRCLTRKEQRKVDDECEEI